MFEGNAALKEMGRPCDFGCEDIYRDLAGMSTEDVLQAALAYLGENKAERADELLTLATVALPPDDRLWLAAGISRMRRGRTKSAACAFQMATWLSGDPEALALLKVCDEMIA